MKYEKDLPHTRRLERCPGCLSTILATSQEIVAYYEFVGSKGEKCYQCRGEREVRYSHFISLGACVFYLYILMEASAASFDMSDVTIAALFCERSLIYNRCNAIGALARVKCLSMELVQMECREPITSAVVAVELERRPAYSVVRLHPFCLSR